MTPAEAFSYALQLKGGERAARILALMDESGRAAVSEAMQAHKDLTLAEIRQRWSDERKAEEDLALQTMKAEMNFDETRLPAALVKWILRSQ